MSKWVVTYCLSHRSLSAVTPVTGGGRGGRYRGGGSPRRSAVHHILIALLFVAGAIVMAANGSHQLY